MIKLGILDDHLLFRKGVIELLTGLDDKFNFSFSSDKPEDLYEFLSEDQVDILLLDIKLEHTNGLEVLEKLRSEGSNLPIIMLTMHDQNAYVRKFIEAGANGYVLKSVSPNELQTAILKVHNNGFFLTEKMTTELVTALKSNSRFEIDNSITEMEMETLLLICEGLTAQEISTKVYKSHRTIEGYRQKLLDKTDSKNIAALVSWAFRNKVVN